MDFLRKRPLVADEDVLKARFAIGHELRDRDQENLWLLAPYNDEDTFKPPENDTIRLAFRSDTGGYPAWGYLSADEMLIMSDTGDVYIQVSEDSFGYDNKIKSLITLGKKDVSRPQHERDQFLREAAILMLKRRIGFSFAERVAIWLLNSRIFSSAK